jgi:adenine phosphoribosyltransferase
MPTAADLNAAIRDVPNFPKEGILFKDITPVLGDAELFKASMELLAETAQGEKIDKVVGIDARGFIFRRWGRSDSRRRFRPHS